jgi:hypothetical protein
LWMIHDDPKPPWVCLKHFETWGRHHCWVLD